MVRTTKLCFKGATKTCPRTPTRSSLAPTRPRTSRSERPASLSSSWISSWALRRRPITRVTPRPSLWPSVRSPPTRCECSRRLVATSRRSKRRTLRASWTRRSSGSSARPRRLWRMSRSSSARVSWTGSSALALASKHVLSRV